MINFQVPTNFRACTVEDKNAQNINSIHEFQEQKYTELLLVTNPTPSFLDINRDHFFHKHTNRNIFLI